MPAKTNLSGAAWWKAHQAQYPNSTELTGLTPGFADGVTRFISTLRSSGANVSIVSTLRHPARAHLMHYSWVVGHGEVEPTNVPAYPGVAIDWDHGDDKASRSAAMEMVHAARMVHVAALSSNHTRGTAIDMTISWKGSLVLQLPVPYKLWEITGRPTTGDNTELHTIGKGVFGVCKLKTDPPHWSHNGR